MDVLEEEPPFEAIVMIAGTTVDEIIQESIEKIKIFEKYLLHNKLFWTEEYIKIILEHYLNCFWYFKEERLEIAAHMLKLGQFLFYNFGCKLKFDGKYYYTDCPNILLHKDYGFSLRGREQYKCSICRKDIIECDHISNNVYNDVICINIDGKCNICFEDFGKCNHIENERYDNVKAIKIVHVIDLITFDLVKDPDMVFTRITKIPFSKNYILKGLKKDEYFHEFEYGKTSLSCDHCHYSSGYNPKRTKSLFKRNK